MDTTIAKPTAFDCFAGCGGMTEGFKQAGFRVVGAIENDAKACEVYSLNHPEVRLWPDDIQSVAADNILVAFVLHLKPHWFLPRLSSKIKHLSKSS